MAVRLLMSGIIVQLSGNSVIVGGRKENTREAGIGSLECRLLLLVVEEFRVQFIKLLHTQITHNANYNQNQNQNHNQVHKSERARAHGCESFQSLTTPRKLRKLRQSYVSCRRSHDFSSSSDDDYYYYSRKRRRLSFTLTPAPSQPDSKRTRTMLIACTHARMCTH